MTTTELAKSFEPHTLEQSIYASWERSGYFEPSGIGDGYCIVIPPPNVTGSLHMGHAFQDTIMDALARYHRMQGCNTLWQPGTDHAGIATQMVVERQLEREGLTRHDLGREAFIERIWQWKKESGGTISRQLRRMGTSLAWSRERFTMDEDLSSAVREVFVRLYEEDLIYRGKRLVNWDPILHTAVSDLEVVSEEESGHLWHIRYPLMSGEGYVVVATTRPETLLGDAAVAVHPEDPRYHALIGQAVELPLTGRTIPIVADDYVDREFGTGCLKITPAHDFNDYEVGQRHGLPLINVLDPSAAIDLPTSPYHGLDRYVAREKIVSALETQGLIEKIDEHRMMVPRGDRSNAVVEPYLTDQWFVRAAPLAAPAIRAVEDGRIRFVPDNWKRTYFEWMHNIQDWCISRQIWWGHRIPAWYDHDGNFFVARTEEEATAQARAHHGHDTTLHQDEDVLDTWFSSALWPFSTLGWPEQTASLKALYPTNVLVTGFDIIFFWVARMIMFGIKFTGEVPFHDVYVHGLVRDADGQKMSKSKGNVLDPLDLIDGIELEELVKTRTSGLMQPQMAQQIEKTTRRQFPDGIASYGTDALRFTFASLATQGRDIRFDFGRIEGFRNFCNKLWNAARFVIINTEGHDPGTQRAMDLDSPERWILARLNSVTGEVIASTEQYRLDLVCQTLHSFVWDEYCSWYLEIAKIRLANEPNEDRAQAVRQTLLSVLETALRLLHPLMPFITEALWQRITPLTGLTGPTIMTQPFPATDALRENQGAVADLDWVKAVVSAVRNIRGEMDIEPRKRIPILLQSENSADISRIEQYQDLISELARTKPLAVSTPDDATPECATALVDTLKVMVPLGSLIDRDAELARLKKELNRLETDRSQCEGKLANRQFIERAPDAVVVKEKNRLEQTVNAIDELIQQRQRVESLLG
jgi:valyl-tRNA synthetase